MTAARSDALVVFGATGDLAHKMIFPALYAMVKRGALRVPVIGVTFPKWSLERLHKCVADSIRRSRGIDDKRAFNRFLSLLKYVSGDYNEHETFAAIRKAFGSARHPARYLAIPPLLFETVIKGLGAAKLSANARVIAGKPFGPPATEYVAMPEGSSSAAPVMMPGPSDLSSDRAHRNGANAGTTVLGVTFPPNQMQTAMGR